MPNYPDNPSSSNPAGELLAFALQPEGCWSTAAAGAPEVPSYEIISRLGAGSSGEVWLANEQRTGRIVALKILHRRGVGSASAEVLRRETQMLSELVHPNIVQLYGAVLTADGRQGLATEWIDGWPLDEWLRMHPDCSLEQQLDLFRGIVRGVAFLHDHGVIHRDLKPANMIVNQMGEAKIVDFGLARLHQEGAATATDGGSIGVSGTLHFMAPEQAANGDGARATPVDVYALGLVLYRLLTGAWLRSPESTPSETLAVVLNPPPLVLPGPARALARDLQSILRMALAPDPARRYRNARDLEVDLDRFAAKLPVAARNHTVAYLTVMLLRRQARRSMIAACVVLAGLAAGGAIYHRHRRLTERNEANLRYAYTLTAYTLGQLSDQLRTAAPEDRNDPQADGGSLPGASDGAALRLPVNAAGELDLRYYQAQLADLRSATSEVHAQYRTALTAIQRALDLYSQLALEAPDDPQRLLDAAKARLSFARLLDRTGRTAGGGGEAHKTLRQLDRLAAFPGFNSAPLSPLRCDALRLAAKAAHRAGQPAEAAKLAREMLATAESMPSGLLVRPENEAAPRLALAAADLATYAISAGGEGLPDARREIDRATAACRAAHGREPKTHAVALGLALCLHAKARMGLHAGPLDELRALVEEGAGLLIGDGSSVRLSSIPLVRDFCATATAWTGAVIDHPDPEVSQAALGFAVQFYTCLRNNRAATDDIMLLRARLYLYESQLACRFNRREQGARPASRAVWQLRSRQLHDPDRLSLALLTAAALHQARSLKEFPYANWNEQEYGAHLDRLLKQLSERSAELTPEQRRELSLLQ
jgi:hypothetical protein